MPLFGNDNQGGGLMSRLFGGSQQPAGPAAQPQPQQAAPIDPRTNPMMAYLSQNQAPAQQVAQQMLGPKPEFDPRMGLIQLGLGILAQPGGQGLGQIIGQAGMNALPTFMQEKQRIDQYDEKVSKLATQLGLSEFEFMSKMDDRKGIAELGGVVVDKDAYQQNLQKYGDPEKAFEESVVFRKSGQKVQDSRELARLERHLANLEASGAPSAEIQEAKTTIRALRQQLEGDTPTTQIFFQDENGRFVSASGTPSGVQGAMNAYMDEKEYRELKNKQEATDQVLDYASRIIDITNRADVAASGKLGGLASSGAAWATAINDFMAGERREQFRNEVGNDPLAKLEEFSRDPTARNLLGENTIEKMREIGNENARALSNMWGLAYATARSQEPGGRLSNADIAASMAAMGFDPEAWLNDPGRIRAGVTELARRNVSDYRRQLELRPDGDQLVQRDILLNKRMQEYGFQYEGGARGSLIYNPRTGDDSTITPLDPPAESEQPEQRGVQGPGPEQPATNQQTERTVPISQMSREQLEQMDPEQMTDAELQEAARRYDALIQGGQ